MPTGKRHSVNTDIKLRLPRFAIFVLRHRARLRRQSVSDVVQALLWNDVLVDEAQAVARKSTAAARAFKAWFREATARSKRA